MAYMIHRLGPADLPGMRAMNALFAEAFEDEETYLKAPPDADYLNDWLRKPQVIALGAHDGDALVGALVAYILDKCEQARSEVYIYDLAVAATHRRQGIATALIEALRPLARAAGASVIFVQADRTDPPAIALYDRLGTREHVLHFDIAVRRGPTSARG